MCSQAFHESPSAQYTIASLLVFLTFFSGGRQCVDLHVHRSALNGLFMHRQFDLGTTLWLQLALFARQKLTNGLFQLIRSVDQPAK